MIAQASSCDVLQEAGRFVSTVGFPVAVASFFLWRMNGKLGRLATAVEENTTATREAVDVLGGGRRKR